MTVFTTDKQLYDCLRDLFARVESSDGTAVNVMQQSNMCFRFRCTAPTALIVIDARKRPLTIEYGTSDVKPDLDIAITVDALHQILLGNLTLTKALGSKQLVPNGPVWKVTKLADLFQNAKEIYPTVLQTHGIS